MYKLVHITFGQHTYLQHIVPAYNTKYAFQLLAGHDLDNVDLVVQTLMTYYRQETHCYLLAHSSKLLGLIYSVKRAAYRVVSR